MNAVAAADLRTGEEVFCSGAVRAPEQKGGQAGAEKAQRESQRRGQQDAPEHLTPLRPVDAAQISLYGNRRAGQPGNQSVAFTGRDPEIPGGSRPDHDSRHGGAQGDQCGVRIVTEVCHIVDGGGDAVIDRCHDQHAEKVTYRRHADGTPHPDGTG